MKKQYIKSIFFSIMIFLILLVVSTAGIMWYVLQSFEEKGQSKRMVFSTEEQKLEKPLTFSIYPWSKYQQKNVSELSQEQLQFVREKQLAECMVELTNYDGGVITDCESTIEMLYQQVRLLQVEEETYYVWYKIPAESVYLFAMANMDGDLFSYHYVTDLDCEDDGTLEYLIEQWNISEENKKGVQIYDEEYEASAFEKNRIQFLRGLENIVNKYSVNLGIKFPQVIFSSIDAGDIINEKGAYIVQSMNSSDAEFVFSIFFDKQKRKVCGYQIWNYEVGK